MTVYLISMSVNTPPGWQKCSIMVASCCVVGYSNRHGEWPGLGFFHFPSVPEERRKIWIIAVRRKEHAHEFVENTSCQVRGGCL